MKKNLQASFNLLDPFENELHDFALKQGKTSSYLKRLIYLDKLSKEGNLAPTPQVVVPVEDDVKKSAMGAIIL